MDVKGIQVSYFDSILVIFCCSDKVLKSIMLLLLRHTGFLLLRLVSSKVHNTGLV